MRDIANEKIIEQTLAVVINGLGYIRHTNKLFANNKASIAVVPKLFFHGAL